MKGAELAAAIAFEQEWDRRIGGLATRVDREYLGYAAGRILESGVPRASLLDYFHALLAFEDGGEVAPS